MNDLRRMSLDDVFALQYLTQARISPDGAAIAFVAARGYTEGEHHLQASNIWLVPWDGGMPARQFTYGSGADTHPRWSPDGSALAFLSDRDKPDTPQIYIIPSNGGEARKLTDAKAGVTSFKWSPDGAQIAFLAADAPSNEEELRQKNKDDAIHVDHGYKFSRLWIVGLSDGTARAITPAEYQVREFAWYGDGWMIMSSPTPLEDDFTGWSFLRVAEGQPDELIMKLRYGTYGLSGSLDGRALAWTHSGAGVEDSVDEVWVMQPDAAPRLLLADYAGGLAWADWAADGKALLVSAIDGTRVAIGRVALETGSVETLLAGRSMAAFGEQPQLSLSQDATRLACVLEDGTEPNEIWASEVGGELRQVTSLNQHLRDLELGSTATIRWQAPDGLEIEGVLIYPAGYQPGQRYPLILLAHGGPTWQWTQRFMVSWHDWGQWLAAHGYAVLLPNPRGSAGRGRDFAHRNRRAWGVGDFDDLLSGVDQVVKQGLADPDRLGVGGWSYGGFLSAWSIGHTDRFKAAVVGAGVTNLISFQASDIPTWLPTEQMLVSPYDDPESYLRSSPISYAAHIHTPTLILHGASDERVRLGQGRELYNALRHRKVTTEMVVYPRETHFITERHHQRDLLTRVVDWYDRWLKP
jgi:dipeptidyl aminopeptidase/acylaminoacyl peptidase